MSVDGVRLRQSWNNALNDAQTQLQSLLTSATSTSWRPVPPVASDTPKDGSANILEESKIIIHKRPSKQGEIFRLVYDIPIEDFSLNAWKAVLTTPEMRQEWDPGVESSQLLELFDVDVRITKTYFTLGWPANPRDAITISRTISDGSTLLDVATSLPRSPDEPPYLRPTPPYVRSQVHLFAWVIQQVPGPSGPKIRLTYFWQHDLKAVWGMGMPSRAHHLCSLMIGAVKTVTKFGNSIPMLQGFGLGVGMERMVFDIGRRSLAIDYSIVHEQESDLDHRPPRGMDEVRAKKERRRLERSLELLLPKQSSWDVQMITRAPSAQGTEAPWSINVYQDEEGTIDADQLLLRTRHAPPTSTHALIKVKLVIEAAAGPAGVLRLNGTLHPIETLAIRDPTMSTIPEPLLQDATNIGAMTFQSPYAGQSITSDDISRTASTRATENRTENGQKSILRLVKRNYVYFASLLQEPEVKWKPLVEARGVSVTQLDSIDPTLVVYRAEAVFVGISIWDLISVISTPGATVYWDKSFDGANLIEDISELTQLWHYKTKAAWPVHARESVLLRSTYKSPTSVHIFSFSTDDSQLFPRIPPSDPNVIRTQVDLRGWAIEALSPTTTQVTLIEQSDPKGWSNKSSLPQQIITAVSGVGEFGIKCGGPPVLTRLGGGRAIINRYEHERSIFRLEYEPDTSRRATSTSQDTTPAASTADLPATASPTVSTRPFVECEIRCDPEIWGGPVDVLIDPPAQGVSCLRRHRLSDNGGGLWITIEHDAFFVMDERLKVTIRKGFSSSAKDKNVVLVNGTKVKVEVEELPEAEIKSLTKRKRVKPIRIPLDQPPVLGAIQRRRAEWAAEDENSPAVDDSMTNTLFPQRPRGSAFLGSPFGRLMTMAVSQATMSTTTAMSAVAKPFALTEQTVPTSNKEPMQHALEALAYLRSLYTRTSQEGWVQVSDNGLPIVRNLETEISRTIPVHKASKVLEGINAEEVINLLTSYDIRKIWDDRFDSAVILQDYGYGCHTAFTVAKGAFPFQPRGFYTATVVACSSSSSDVKAEEATGSDTRSSLVHYIATASFNPQSIEGFSSNKYNPSGYATGRVLVRGWICETLDPYTTENYAIPSTRCTFVSAVDFAGAVPAAYNSVLNSSLPRAILRFENYLKQSANLPFLYTPSFGIAIEPEEGPQEGWSFQRRDQSHLLLGRQYLAEQNEFQAIVVVDMTHTGAVGRIDDTTPTPSKFLNKESPPSPTSVEAFHRPRTVSLSPPGAYNSDIRRSHSPDGTSPFRHNTVGRASSSNSNSMAYRRKPLPSFSAQNDAIFRDFVVADLVVDSKLFPQGFTVHTKSIARIPEETLDLNISSADQPTNTLPIEVKIFAISNALFKASYSDRSGSRYLVRISLPTSLYDAPPLDDPLTGQTIIAPPRPPWLVDLMERGGVVQISIKAAPDSASSTTPSGSTRVFIGTEAADIVNERKSLTVLGKEQFNPLMSMPWVARSDNILFPKDLSTPLAVSKALMKPVSSEVTEAINVPQDLDKKEQPEQNVQDQNLKPSKEIVPPPPRPGFNALFTSYISWWARKVPSAGETKVGITTEQNDDKQEGSSSVITTPAEPMVTQLVATRSQALLQRKVSISTVLIIGFICFLLGSLVRSLLTPTDFVIIRNDGDLGDVDDHLGWRRLTRLIELKYILRGNDLIIGIAHA